MSKQPLTGMEKARLQMIVEGKKTRADFWISTTRRLLNRRLLASKADGSVTITATGRKALAESPHVLAWMHGTSDANHLQGGRGRRKVLA